MASPSLFTSVAVPYLPSPRNEGSFSARFAPTHLAFPRLSLGLSTVARARRRSSDSAAPKKKKKQQSSRKNHDEEEEEEEDEDEDFGGDMDEDAFDALFKQLEEDLKNDTSLIGDDDGDFDDLTEEDFLKVEQALAEAFLGDDDDEDEDEDEEDDDDIELTASSVDDIGSDNDDGDDEEDDDDEEEVDEDGDDDDYEEVEEVKLKNWQLRRLASALKVGKRKTSIKLLAAELCLDRAVVLRILRDPPPKLLMYSATLPDFKPTKAVTSVPVPVPEEPVETVPETAEVEPQTKVGALDPVHVRQSRWTAQKGLKKVQAQTLEQVYRKSKRPTNAMINSIVQVTNLPRKRIVKWFEDKRAENGVVDKYPVPYQRSDRKTTTSQ